MRILLICAAYPPYGKGGGPASSELLALGLAARGHIVRVLTVADEEALQEKDGLEIKTIKTLNVYWDYWKKNPAILKLIWHGLENFNPRAFTRMRAEIREFTPDIVVTISIENVNVATWLAARLEQVPVAHMLYSYFLLCWRGSMFRGDHVCLTRCRRCILSSAGKKAMSRYVDGVAGELDFVLQRHLVEGYFTQSLPRVVPVGIMSLPPTPTGIFEGSRLRVGYIGLHSHNKGIETLARAARLMPNDAKVEFVIAGDGDPEYTKRLQQSFGSASTRFLGWTSPSESFTQVDLTVVPSLWSEPFGRVSIESMSYGVPVLVARSGGLPSNISEGVTGYSFNPGDHAVLADQIQRLSGDRELLKRLGTAARNHAEQFSITKIAGQFEAFLQETIEYAQRRHLPLLSGGTAIVSDN